MPTYSSPIKRTQGGRPQYDAYYSVEFALKTPYPVYQFKLWRTRQNSLFLIVKDNSSLLPQLKVGKILPMKYLSGNARGHMEVRDTRIDNIVNEQAGRFQGHHRIDLAPVASETKSHVR